MFELHVLLTQTQLARRTRGQKNLPDRQGVDATAYAQNFLFAREARCKNALGESRPPSGEAYAAATMDWTSWLICRLRLSAFKNIFLTFCNRINFIHHSDR